MQTVRLMTKPAMARQGDVLIVPVSRPVDDADVGTLLEEPDKSRVVLAHGEATGHAHAFYPHKDIAEGVTPHKTEKPVQLFELRNADRYCAFDRSLSGVDQIIRESRLLRLRAPTTLRHEEHDPIRFPAGDYVVVRQFEYDDSEELRRVAD